MASPRQRVSLPSARDLALGKARVSSSDHDCSLMLQIKGLRSCFTAYEKDHGVKLLIVKVSHTTLFVL